MPRPSIASRDWRRLPTGTTASLRLRHGTPRACSTDSARRFETSARSETRARFLRNHDRAEILLIANRPWDHKLLPPEKVKFIPWTPQNEASTLHEMSVGIMPLPDTDWARGKCSFKMLQYMAVSLPVVVSPVGMNQDILQKGPVGLPAQTPDHWYQALESLYNNWSQQTQMGTAGRSVVEKFYNAKTIAKELAKIIKNTSGA